MSTSENSKINKVTCENSKINKYIKSPSAFQIQVNEPKNDISGVTRQLSKPGNCSTIDFLYPNFCFRNNFHPSEEQKLQRSRQTLVWLAFTFIFFLRIEKPEENKPIANLKTKENKPFSFRKYLAVRVEKIHCFLHIFPAVLSFFHRLNELIENV
jgi:hypothetical protein